MFAYRLCGLAVQSKIALAGAAPGDPTDHPDVTIMPGAVAGALAGARATGPAWQLGDGALLLAIPGAGRCLIERAGRILYQAEPGAEDGIAAFLSGNAFGILLQLRGQVALQASAIAVGDRAVLFLGASATGKSTIAAMLAMRGHAVIADGLAALSVDAAGRAQLHGDGAQLQLWADAVARLSLAEHRGAPLRPGIAKSHVDLGARIAGAMPVAALYALRDVRNNSHPAIERANLVDASKMLVSLAYRPLLVTLLDQRPAYLAMSAALGMSAGTFQLTRTRGFQAVDETLDMLAAHWREIGLVAA